MKIVRVTYTTTPDYADTNQNNIQQVMQDLQKQNHPGILYHACLGADGKSFTHTAFFQSDEDEKILLSLPSFKEFQVQLKASGPETPPKQEHMTLVGSSHPIFHS